MAILSLVNTERPNLLRKHNAFMCGNRVFEIALAPREICRLDGDQRGLRIRSVGGKLWITQSGDTADYYIEGNEHFTVTQPGPIVLQGMCNSTPIKVEFAVEWARVRPSQSAG